MGWTVRMTKDEYWSYATNCLEPSMRRKHLFYKIKIDFDKFQFYKLHFQFEQDILAKRERELHES